LSYYLFVVVSGKEANLIQKGYRILNQIDNNIHDKAADLKKNAGFIFNACSQLTNDNDSLKRLKETWSKAKENRILHGSDPTENAKYGQLMAAVEKKSKIFLTPIFKIDKNWDSFWNPKKENFYYLFLNNNSILDLSLQVSYDSLIKGTIHTQDFFENIVIVKDVLAKNDNAASYKKMSNDSAYTYIIYQSFPNKVKIKFADSLLHLQKGIYSGGVFETEVSDNKYKVFVHQMKFSENENWIILGFANAATLRQNSQAVSPVLLYSTFLLFILILLSIPALKLGIMSGFERLQISNVISIGISLALGVTIFVLIIISTIDFWISRNSQFEKVAKVTDEVHQRFVSEIDVIVSQLNSLQDYYQLTRTKYQNIGNSPRPWETLPVFKKDDQLIINNLKPVDFPERPVFNQLIWFDSTGSQRLVISSTPTPISNYVYLLNLKERNYFKKIRSNETWTRNGKNFYVQSIVSWYDGQLECAISIPLKTSKIDPAVLAMTTPLFSTCESVLPQGYEFCIIDENGKVQFHSDKSKNLRENLIEETDKNDHLISCINNRVAETFTGTYIEKDHLFSIKPIEGTPWFVVGIYDMDYFQVPIEMATWFTSLLLLTMFILISIHFLLLFIATYQSTKLKIKRFFLDWIRPRTNEMARIRYSSLGILNFMLCLLPLAFISNWAKLIVMLMPIYILYISFTLIKSASKEIGKGFKFTLLTTLYLLLIDLVIIVVLKEKVSINLAFIIVSISIPIVIMAIHIVLEKAILNFAKPLFSNPKYTLHYYYFYTISCLVATSVVPVIVFYGLSHRYENLVWSKFNQLETSKSIYRLNKIAENKSEAVKCLLANYSNYAYSSGDFKEVKDTTKIKFIEPTRREEILASVRIGLTHLTKLSKYCTYPSSTDNTWMARRDLAKTVTNYQGLTLQSTEEKKFWLTNIRSAQEICFAIISIAGGIWLLSALLKYVIKHVYGIEIYSERYSSSVSVNSLILREPVSTAGAPLSHDKVINSKMFLVGLPHSGKLSCIEELKKFLKENNESLKEINLKGEIEKDPKRLLRKKYDWVIISHFEYGLNSHEYNNKKLHLLEKLNQDSKTKIIISSSVQPSSVLDFYETMIERALSKDKSDESYTEIKEFRIAFRQWQNILSGFVTIYQSLLVKDINFSGKYENDEIKKTVNDELRYGNYLGRLEPFVFKYYNGITTREGENEIYKPDKEDIILRIETLADSYYQSMWNSFTRKEKFLLFDLAKDRFVNTNNIKEIKILLEKGVIQMTDSIRLMNKSFNNFILSVVKEDEEILMEREMDQKGNWNTVQLVLVLSLLGLAIFFALAQQNLLQNFNTLIGVIGAVLALAVRFGGFFGSGPKQKDN
jgi:hypothetical protein